MRIQQLNLFSGSNRLEHGGHVRRGARKLARPIDPKRPLHLVLKSSRARGAWSFLHRRHKGRVYLLVLDTAERYGIKIYRQENVGNHLHLVVQARRRREMQAFLRVLPQRIMFAVTGARRGNPVGRFFDAIVYSRVVSWGRDWVGLLKYLGKNTLEALGFGAQKVREFRRRERLVPL